MIYLTPIQGTTDRIYRNLFPIYYLAIAPFIPSVKKMKTENKHLSEFYLDRDTSIPTIPQVLSSDPADFTMLANALYGMGCGTIN